MSSTHVLELALQVSPAAEKKLLARLEAARQVYNACLGQALKRRERLVNSPTYQMARKLSKGKARTQAFAEAREGACFSEYALHAYAKQFGHSWLGEHLDSLTIQALASRAYRAVHSYVIGQHGRPRFKGYGRLHSVEGKTNASGIRWTGEGVVWSGLALPAIIDPADPLVKHGLACPVKYVRLVRRRIAGRDRFYAQLVLAGTPYRKPKHQLGQGRVGLDIGPSTIAIVSEHAAFLKQFCAALADRQRHMRRLERQRDRQRRAGNADNYLPDGRVKPGAWIWHKSGRQRRTDARLAELHRRLAAHRKSLQGQLVNDILALGDQIYLEQLSYRAFQRRFGRSVGRRAPGLFVSLLKRKAESAGTSVHEFPTTTTRLSQICHGCGAVVKKPLAERWHVCACGVVAQRDLYAAFLAMCVDNDHLNADRAHTAWSSVDMLLQAALRTVQPASGEGFPASFGLNQRPSRSPVEAGLNVGEAAESSAKTLSRANRMA